MDDELREVSERDQHQASLRDFAIALAKDTGAHRRTLIEDEGMPKALADKLTIRFHDAWVKAHVEAQAGVGVTGFMYAEVDDE